MAIDSLIMLALQQYLLLGLVLLAAYGLGRLVCGWMHAALEDHAILIPLQLGTGTGAGIMWLLCAGMIGHFNAIAVGTLLLIGIARCLTDVCLNHEYCSQVIKNMATAVVHTPMAGRWLIGIALLLFVPYLLAPLQIPLHWDELAYHLPYMRSWANDGYLTVNQWLRYPLLPFNMNLLYGAALIFHNDLLPHLLHASTGALTCLLTFAIAKRYFNWPTGLLAGWMVFNATNHHWENAYVDLGLMFFWSAAFACLALRYHEHDERYCLIAALFAGFAIGIKYQALLYLPVFLAVALLVERRPSVVLKSALIFSIAGSFWYVRNWIISGDPVHPLGAEFFGYWLWNSTDMTAQLGDINRVRDWPNWYFLAAPAAILFWRSAAPFYRCLMLTTMGAFTVWYLAVGYTRYLLPIYPMLSLLSASVLMTSGERLKLDMLIANVGNKIHPALQYAMFTVVLVMALLNAIIESMEKSRNIAWNYDRRQTILAERFQGFALLDSLEKPPAGPLYQLGFEGEIYYLGTDVRGDVFGPGRYSSVLALAQDADALADYLHSIGIRSLLVNKARAPFDSISWSPDMSDRFEMIANSADAVLYRLR